jgi:hypothetical protein
MEYAASGSQPFGWKQAGFKLKLLAIPPICNL